MSLKRGKNARLAPPGRESLREVVVRLSPWHYPIELPGGLNTSIVAHDRMIANPGPATAELMKRIYDGDVRGKSALDCACNCGVTLLHLKDAGFGRCLGFDLRPRWIEQGELLKHLGLWRGSEDVEFLVDNLYEVPKRNLEPFDVTVFGGIFYHLSDPILGLRIASDLTREILLVETATRTDVPDGALVAEDEDPEQPLSGRDRLCWFPTGPEVMSRLLLACGFTETFVVWHETEGRWPNHGRLQMVGSKKRGLLARLARWVLSSRTSNEDDPCIIAEYLPAPSR